MSAEYHKEVKDKFEDYSEALFDHSDFIIYKYYQEDNFEVSSERLSQIFFDFEEDFVKERFDFGNNSFKVDFDDLSYSSKLLLELDYTFCELNSLVSSHSTIKKNLKNFDKDEANRYIEFFTCSIDLINFIYTTFMPHDQDVKVFLCRYCEWLEKIDHDGKKLFDVKPSETFLAFNVHKYDLDTWSLNNLDESFETFKALDNFWRKKWRMKRHWVSPEYPPNTDYLNENYDMSFEKELKIKYPSITL